MVPEIFSQEIPYKQGKKEKKKSFASQNALHQLEIYQDMGQQVRQIEDRCKLSQGISCHVANRLGKKCNNQVSENTNIKDFIVSSADTEPSAKHIQMQTAVSLRATAEGINTSTVYAMPQAHFTM